MTKEQILKQYFGYDSFRHGQAELIDNILNGRDVLGIMPTGAGKSVCYQVPALLLDGVTIVISPLISLMKDQVGALLEAGIPSAFLNSSLSDNEYSNVISETLNGKYKILYVAPERLDTEGFVAVSERIKISMVTVDEAHCVSQWGQDFRPSYARIINYVSALSYRPIVSAFTATATSEVRDDICAILRLENPFVPTTGFNRNNLYFAVEKPKNKYAAVLKILEKNKDKSGIIYCISRRLVEEVCDKLSADGYSVTRYHAGLTAEERRRNQDAFIYDEKSIVVATNAFGMGIDKSNVSFVIHYNMPKNIESYYQEAGRAGRDGEPAECVLLYAPGDVRTNTFLIERGENGAGLDPETAELVRQRDRERLKKMTFYSTTSSCLREFMLNYFGEKAPSFCGNCGNCNANFELVDVTTEAQKIISCIGRLKQRGQSFGMTTVAGILFGSKRENMQRYDFEQLSTFGIMSDSKLTRIQEIIRYLAQNEYITLTDGEYPVLQLNERSRVVISGGERVMMKLVKSEITEEKERKRTKKGEAYAADFALFTILRELRLRLAREEGIPPYMVFADAALRDMCVKYPRSEEEFLDVAGVGKMKAAKYGEVFIKAIFEYKADKSSDEMQTPIVGEMSVFEILCANKDKIGVWDEPVALTVFVDGIFSDLRISAKVTFVRKAIKAWLMANCYLRIDESGETKQTRLTEKSEAFGIITVEKPARDGHTYKNIMYTPKAQRAIIAAFDEIAALADK